MFAFYCACRIPVFETVRTAGPEGVLILVERHAMSCSRPLQSNAQDPLTFAQAYYVVSKERNRPVGLVAFVWLGRQGGRAAGLAARRREAAKKHLLPVELSASVSNDGDPIKPWPELHSPKQGILQCSSRAAIVTCHHT